MRNPLPLPLTPLILMTVLATSLGSSRAELPPDAYRDMQQSAPEAVILRVRAVDTSICWLWLCDGQDVVVDAEIQAITRTATGLEPGARIEIRYRHVPLGGRSGPRAIRIVAEGEETAAFLARTDGGHYRPAARGASFQALVPIR